MTATEINQTIATDVELTATDTAGLVATGYFEFGSVSAPEPPTAVDLARLLQHWRSQRRCVPGADSAEAVLRLPRSPFDPSDGLGEEGTSASSPCRIDVARMADIAARANREAGFRRRSAVAISAGSRSTWAARLAHTIERSRLWPRCRAHFVFLFCSHKRCLAVPWIVGDRAIIGSGAWGRLVEEQARAIGGMSIRPDRC